MLKTSEITDALLDYWTARAEGIPAENLQIRRVQRSADFHCVRTVRMQMLGPDQSAALDIAAEVMRYSADWAQGGPLIEKYSATLRPPEYPTLWEAHIPQYDEGVVTWAEGQGDIPLQAICRAVVRAAFGDEVEEVAVCG